MGKKRVITKSDSESQPSEAKKLGGVKSVRKMTRAVANVQATYNNTMITVCDEKGNALASSSAGSLGFSGAKKATPYAAARVAEAVTEKIRKFGIQQISVMVSGVGAGRDSAIRSLANQGLDIISIRDVTPIPHNGPRAKKVRRV